MVKMKTFGGQPRDQGSKKRHWGVEKKTCPAQGVLIRFLHC